MRSETYICRTIDGDGPPGPERKVHAVSFFHEPSDAAEFFVSELVDQEMRDERMGEDDLGHFHGAAYLVEVRIHESADWQRFGVRCKVKLEFELTLMPPVTAVAPKGA